MWETGTCNISSMKWFVLSGQGLSVYLTVTNLDIFENFSSSVINLSHLVLRAAASGNNSSLQKTVHYSTNHWESAVRQYTCSC